MLVFSFKAKKKLRQQNSCWYIVLQEESMSAPTKVCGHRAVGQDHNPLSIRRHEKSIKNHLVLLFGEVSGGFSAAGCVAGFS